MSNNEVEKAAIIYAIRETLKVVISDLTVDLSPRDASSILAGTLETIETAIGHLDNIPEPPTKGE